MEAARLTAIAVTFARRSRLGIPVGTIVANSTAFPVVVVVGLHPGRQPVSFALYIAEMVIEFAKLVLLAGERLTTSIAGHCDRCSCHVSNVAFRTTERLSSLANVVWGTCEVFSTHWARYGRALVTGGGGAYQGFEVSRHAPYVTEVVLAGLELVGIAFKLLAAVSARYGELAGLGWHEKPPANVTDALAEGAPVVNRRRDKHIELPAIRQQQVHPQHMEVYHGLPVFAMQGGPKL